MLKAENRQIDKHIKGCVLIRGAFFLILAGFLVAFVAQAQSDSLQETPENQAERHISSPVRAAMLSATLPGMGQVYNRKYWKVPIVYAGFGTLVYFLDMNLSEYQRWRTAYIARVDGNPNTVDDYPFHSTHHLQRAMEYYRRNLEVTYILAAALYILNILDASVDAHLMDFDVGEDLAIGFRPQVLPHIHGASRGPSAALGIYLRF